MQYISCGGVVVPGRGTTRASGLFAESTRFLRVLPPVNDFTNQHRPSLHADTGIDRIETSTPLYPSHYHSQFRPELLRFVPTSPSSRLQPSSSTHPAKMHIRTSSTSSEFRFSLHPIMTTGGRGRRYSSKRMDSHDLRGSQVQQTHSPTYHLDPCR